MKSEFRSTRRSVVFSAVIAGIVSFGLLLLLEAKKESLFTPFYAAAVNVCGVIFGLAVVSFGWEFLVRRDHGRELRHYLRLGGAVTGSGLQRAIRGSAIDWRELTEAANKITVVAVDLQWFKSNAYGLLEIARNRALVIEYLLPGEDSAVLQRVGSLTGRATEKIIEEFQAGADEGLALWRSAASTGRELHPGSNLTFRLHDYSESYQIVVVDQLTVLMVAAPGIDSAAQDPFALAFEQNNDEYPTRFLRSFEKNLKNMTRMGTL
ncbi:hypothetical protein QUG92_08690 [Curtobacterium sp. RHCKG23]|uniref:Uncharacterized protein n=1 Tax=Curtobacterium citri TaxID=3055139 RepID=A0ABT7T896_9MICO|nr:hypothetical protein [Curtobacterium citri]MDM7885182.1 hypothetical protein [Curtobacterium citri]